MQILKPLPTFFQKRLGHFLQIRSTTFESVHLGSKSAHPRSESHSRFSIVQKELEELNFLSQEIYRAVQNSEIVISPNPF